MLEYKNMKYILFPLGNVGDKYENTRHNAGRFVYEKVKSKLEKNLEVFIPKCFMNESGIYLKKEIRNKNIKTENIIVIYDDKDLEIGDVRVAINRGDGGHNGIKNIIHELGTKNFYRIRIGIAPKGTGSDGIIPPHGDLVQKYVLSNFTDYEKSILSDEKYLDKVCDMIGNINKLNNRK
jgi:PTH1 family peptidyl-tRNA hydrolase